MNDERQAKRNAYIAAKTHYRAYYERFYPVAVPGSRAAETVTAEALAEIERLKAVAEAARVAWEAPDPT